MGVPEWVNTEYHHKPADIRKLAELNPETKLVLTHTYIDSDYEIVTKDFPEMPSNVVHGEDSMRFEITDSGQGL